MTAVTVAPKQIISNTPSGRRFRQNPWRRYPSRPWPRNRISAARRADWSRRRNPPYALDRQIADLPVGQIDPRARRHLLCMFANSLMESFLRMVRCATTATTEARMLGLRGQARNHSGNPALRRPSLKRSASSGRLQILAKIPWLIVNQGSIRSASAASSLALSSCPSWA